MVNVLNLHRSQPDDLPSALKPDERPEAVAQRALALFTQLIRRPCVEREIADGGLIGGAVGPPLYAFKMERRDGHES